MQAEGEIVELRTAGSERVNLMFGISGRWRFLAMAPGLGIVLGGAIACASNPGAAATATSTEQALELAIHGYEDHAVDVGEHGRSSGDTFFVQYELWNSDQTEKVGEYATACVLERDYGQGRDLESLTRCTATAFLDAGNIELAGRQLRTESEESLGYSVIGGTGAYRNAVGEATVVFGDEDTPDTLKLDLTVLDTVTDAPRSFVTSTRRRPGRGASRGSAQSLRSPRRQG